MSIELEAACTAFKSAGRAAEQAARLADAIASAFVKMAEVAAATPAEAAAPEPLTGAARMLDALRTAGLLPNPLVGCVDACLGTLWLGAVGEEWAVQKDARGYVVLDAYGSPVADFVFLKDAFSDVLDRVREAMREELVITPGALAADLRARGHVAEANKKSVEVVVCGRKLTLSRVPRKQLWDLLDGKGASVLPGGPTQWYSAAHSVDVRARGGVLHPSRPASPRAEALAETVALAAEVWQFRAWMARPTHTSPWSPGFLLAMRAGVPAGITVRTDAAIKASVARLDAL